ncbi:M3 family oligoendopeptidase [Clostridium butanoliproducens]|uniref:M3 family oligoendopeptidase n=1 Tax=Clostridium butanoliproducens TaxID=2991837 RepID=UPI0024BBA69B|nr:M3 family oligoendopeptidase [Clostridium butanoliproducens]
MECRWSLKELYDSFESASFKEDMTKLEDYVDSLNKFGEKLNDTNDSKSILEEYISLYKDITILVNKLFSYTSLTMSVDTKNEIALKNLNMIENKYSEIAAPLAKINKFIGSIENLKEIIEESPLLKEHEYHLNEIAKRSKYFLSEKEEAIIAKMRNSGSSAWNKMMELLVSNLKVDIEENGQMKELPLSVVRNLAYDKDKEIRKKAYEAELKSYEKIEDAVAASLNGIKGEVITVCKLRGFTSPLEETLFSSRMDKETLDAMISAMKESLPVFRKYLRRKAELLGYKNGLPFYELFAPMGNADMKFEYEKGKAFVEENFRTFSDKLADFARKAFDNNWIDVYPREGKVGGAFCAGLHMLGESRLMLNYGNTFSDVVTLAHELGHGYHGECLKEESILNSEYPMPIAETASTFCETIIKKAAIKAANKEEAFSILETEISDSTQVIVDILSRYIFETNLFSRREESSLSSNELKELMINAQLEAYGDGLDREYLHPYMWLCKGHYYSAGLSFYNFPYAFGLLFAKGLYADYLKRGEDFVKDYDKLLSLTGKMDIADLTKLMNIDIHSIDFWRNSLKVVEEDIEKFIELSKEI